MNKTHADELQRFILDSAIEANILPLTSRCDRHCVFCSHKNNPPGITAVSVGVRSMEEITRTMAFLDPGHVITIGESATPIIEGEPFSHPGFREIIALVRRAFPDTPLEITTNGRFLTTDMVGFLAATGNTFLNVSLNSASGRGRGLLMGDTREESERTIAGIGSLARSAIRFSGSLVAMPNLTGWDDIRDTVAFLAENKAVAIRVIMPAFSSCAREDVFPDADRIYRELREFMRTLSAESPCPVLIEPSCVSDLTPVVSGVLRDSPAWNAGIRRDDVFVTINGQTPRCRVEAWNLLLPAGEVVAEIRGDDRTRIVAWTNRSEGDSGITMEYDFDPVRAGNIRQSILDRPGKSVLLTSELGHSVVGKVLELMDIGGDKAEAVVVKNRTFGGTIRAAGLLTVDDYLESYAAWDSARRGSDQASCPDPSQVIVPLESFDSRGFDLKRVHFSELEKRAGVPVALR
jgi:molybdenum cofactor biosynthesis enzyme MoaA